MYETCFKDRGIDWLCMKRVSEIGVLIRIVFFSCFLHALLSVAPFLFLLISRCTCLSFCYPLPLILPLSPTLLTMSSPASSYVQVGLDNLERPLNHSPSPRAQVRGLIGLLFVDD